jgi:hypothetical protein
MRKQHVKADGTDHLGDGYVLLRRLQVQHRHSSAGGAGWARVMIRLHPALRSSEPVAAGSPPASTRSSRWKAFTARTSTSTTSPPEGERRLAGSREHRLRPDEDGTPSGTDRGDGLDRSVGRPGQVDGDIEPPVKHVPVERAD